MRQLLISAAALAFLAAPAFAQPDDHRGHEGGNRGGAPAAGAPAQAQAPQPQPQRGGNGGPTSFTNQPPQGTLPNGQTLGGGNRGGGDRGRNQAQQAAQPQAVAPQQGRDFNRGGNRDYRGNGQNYRGDNRYGNRGGYNGQRHDFSSFRDFHRDFRASRRFRGPDYRRPAGWYDHRWTFGEFLPSAFWARDYWLSDYGAYDLPPPPYGAIWVRVGRDALLVDQDSGEVITVEYDVFY